MTLPQLVEYSLHLQALETAANKEAEVNKQKRTVVETFIRDIMNENEQTAATTAAGSVLVSKKEVQNVKNWDDFYEYIYKNKAFYLLQRRVSSTALAEAMNLEEVPGVEKVSLTQVTVKPIKQKL
jgi:nitric oxide reductase large subunit